MVCHTPVARNKKPPKEGAFSLLMAEAAIVDELVGCCVIIITSPPVREY